MSFFFFITIKDMFIDFLKKIFLEREAGIGERETFIGCLSSAPSVGR